MFDESRHAHQLRGNSACGRTTKREAHIPIENAEHARESFGNFKNPPMKMGRKIRIGTDSPQRITN